MVKAKIYLSMYVLGIESSCDETAAAIVKDGTLILSHVIASQADLHEKYGGVFPELASRRHSEVILPTIDQALKQSNISCKELGLIAVTNSPGLMGPLLIGVNTAKTLSLAWKIPLIGVNHVEAHLYAAMMENPEVAFPALGVVLSGGHTQLYEIHSPTIYKKISSTVDDAVGEAFDKVATLLGLPYPGGPQIEKMAKKGDPIRFSFPSGRVKRSPLDFSFSGLKTAVLYKIEKMDKPLSEQDKYDLAASFQRAALSDIVEKTLLAAKQYPCKGIVLGGGVVANLTLRQLFQDRSSLPLFWPSMNLCTDNAAMIAGLGFQNFLISKEPSSLSLSVLSRN